MEWVIASVSLAGVFAAWDGWRRALQARRAEREYDRKVADQLRAVELAAAEALSKAQRALNHVESQKALQVPRIRVR